MKTKCVCLAALSTYIQTGFPMHFSAVSENPYYKQEAQVLTDMSEVSSFLFLEKEHGFWGLHIAVGNTADVATMLQFKSFKKIHTEQF